MRHSKDFWRGLFFILLITAVCGELVLPTASVYAAPQRQAATDLVISEFRVRGSAGAGDEFVEIYNPTASSVNLNGWQVRGSNNAGGSGNRLTFTTNILLQPGQHYLISNNGYDDSVTADATYAAGITDDGGVALLRPDNSIADQVGFTTACPPNTCYVEGTPLTSLGTSNIDRSYDRNIDASGVCADSNNNVSDFFLRNPSDPQNSSSPITVCGNSTPTPTPTFTPTDTATPTNTPTATDTPTPTSTGATSTPTNTPSTGSATNVVISEFRTTGPGGGDDEFVELYNPTSNWIDISGWIISGSSSNGGTQARATIPASTILRSGQYYLVANNGYSNTSVPADLKYSASIADNGGIGLIRPDNSRSDEVGMSTNSAYQEGTTLPPFPNPNQSYERKVGGLSGSCVDTNNNASDFSSVSPTPHNSSTILFCDGTTGPSLSTTTTTITADSPDPSLVNENVTVSVTVTGGATTPTGKVNITGADTNCTITLNGTGTGSCNVNFTSTGTKGLVATYLGDNTHASSTVNEAHQVSAPPPNTPTITPTITPTNTPSTGSATSVVISEFRTAGSDEFIELYNPTINAVDISGWKINGSSSTGSAQTRATIPASILLRSGQYYLLSTKSSFTIGSTTITANLTYGTGISDDGGIGLYTSTDQPVDEVGMSAGSTYQEGTPLSPLTNAGRSYERKDGDPSGSCVDTNNNANDFFVSNSPTPHNYSTIRFCNGTAGPSLSTTTTTITTDSPDPSLVNANVNVGVKVTGGTTTPTGKVNITGANTNCTVTLNSSGTGSCTVKFTTLGTKGLIANYLGDNTHNASSDSEAHQVNSSTFVPTPTPRPTPLPPPPLIGLNEFVPRPGHDWNHDGTLNAGDEYIEVINHGVIDVSLSGYSLDDEANIGSQPYALPAITLKPGERHVFFGSETGLLLSDGGDGVRLLKPNGQLGDAYNYFVVRFPDQSYCRLPDNGGLDDWNQNCFPTPGLQNSQSGTTVNPPTENGEQTLCPISDTLPSDFMFAECLPFGNNIWNPEYWDKFGWFDGKYLENSPGKWPIFAE